MIHAQFGAQDPVGEGNDPQAQQFVVLRVEGGHRPVEGELVAEHGCRAQIENHRHPSAAVVEEPVEAVMVSVVAAGTEGDGMEIHQGEGGFLAALMGPGAVEEGEPLAGAPWGAIGRGAGCRVGDRMDPNGFGAEPVADAATIGAQLLDQVRRRLPQCGLERRCSPRLQILPGQAPQGGDRLLPVQPRRVEILQLPAAGIHHSHRRLPFRSGALTLRFAVEHIALGHRHRGQGAVDRRALGRGDVIDDRGPQRLLLFMQQGVGEQPRSGAQAQADARQGVTQP